MPARIVRALFRFLPRPSSVLVGIALVGIALVGTLTAQRADPRASRIDFNREVRPILANRCLLCHGPDRAARKGGAKGSGGLRLDTEEGSRADLGGVHAIVPGRPDQSELLRRITATGKSRMPPRRQSEEALPEHEVEILRRWITEGAAYDVHWSYRKPCRPVPPEVARPAWSRNAVDRFVLARLEAEGLEPSEAADRHTLIRRVTLDLTGLPPSDEETRRFVQDPDPDAYGKLVERLLASDAYGEHQARHWLDLARYADSAGYADDPPREIWAYRDWVIRAFNSNQPFDQFTIDQLAGDLLGDPTEDQLIATAFHRNTMTNSEGGTDDEEFRNVAVVDRVNTTMSVWMGTTMACAQCHDHKYDPFTQKEYFELFAFLNSTEDSDKRNEQPRLALFSQAQRRQKAALSREATELRAALEADTRETRDGFARWDRDFPRDAVWHSVELTSRESPRHLHIETGPATITALRGTFTPRPKNTVRLGVVPAMPRVRHARFVRVELPGERRILSLAEVQVFRNDDNIARSGEARQSSTDFNGPAKLAIDGNTDGDFATAKSTTHTAISADPWWEVDLGNRTRIDRVRIWNRTGGAALARRLVPFRLLLLDDSRKPVFEQRRQTVAGPMVELRTGGPSELRVASSWRAEDRRSTLLLARTVEREVSTLRIARTDVDTAGRVQLEATGDPAFANYRESPGPVLAVLATNPAQRSVAARTLLRRHYRSIAPELRATRERLAEIEKQLASMKPFTSVPILRELPAKAQRRTHIHIRGSHRIKGAEVERGVPSAFHALDHSEENAPRDRLALARWLVSPENPLAARVLVNRFWESLFGVGLVATSEDFGVRGELPSHPQLLDWLAVEFIESGWDVKALLAKLVTSATYRQTSTCSEALRARDPANRLLARGPRFRLSAEMIRDQALRLSGLLSTKKFGPPVRPPRPNLGLRAAFGASTDWKNSTGQDRYRRAIYTQWRRSIPYPSMAIFDAPNRDVCVVRRVPTNTPLQALVTLNDPVYVEAAQALARRVVADGGPDTRARASFAIRHVLSRPGTSAEVARITELVRDATARYRETPAQAKLMATDPLGPLPEGADASVLAAWTVAANVLLNLDEILVKR